ncbi:hypothetical protein [Amycolatopsis minnesotensis]
MDTVIVIIGIPPGFGVPVVAARLRDHRPLVLGVAAHGTALGQGPVSGHLLNATGPPTFGVLHNVTGGWEASLWLVGPELACGLLTARPGLVRPGETALDHQEDQCCR